MLSLTQRKTILDLINAGLPVTEITRRTRKSAATVYKYKNVKEDELGNVDSKEFSVPIKLQPFEDRLGIYLQNPQGNISKFFKDLKALGYKGSYGLLYTYIRTKQGALDISYRRSAHIETGPGEQAQVDWGSFGRIQIGNRIEKLYAFVYVLSYSRALYIEFVIRQNQQTLQNCHIHAFETLGIPKRIRYDNMKTVVLSREKLPDGTKKVHFNPAFLDFASYYGFEAEACPPYWPRAKGKVEAGVKYVRSSFVAGEWFGKTFYTLDELNKKANIWLNSIAQERIHATTKEKPVERWKTEKEFLKFPSDVPPYNTAPLLSRMSTKDGLICYKSNLYSVPSRFSRKRLDVREVSKSGQAFIEIYYHDILVATHPVSLERGKWIMNEEHTITPERQSKQKPLKGKTRNSNMRNIIVSTRELNYYNFALSK